MEALLQKRVLLVTGKGGVGRSTVTAAVARLAQARGKRVLVCEVADESNDFSALARLFGREVLPGTAETIAPGILGSRLVPLTGQTQFLTSVIKVGALARAAMSSDALRRLLQAAPSFREMGIFYHLLTYLRATRADGAPVHELVILDMPATGHTLALTGLPEVLHRLVTRGPIPDALREGQAYLNDPKLGAALVVTLPETLPVTEALELMQGLTRDKVHVGGAVVNRVPADPFTADERAALTPWLSSAEVLGADAFAAPPGATRCIERLATLGRVPLFLVPELVGEGQALVQAVAGALQVPR